jgi:hypothetical protein
MPGSWHGEVDRSAAVTALAYNTNKTARDRALRIVAEYSTLRIVTCSRLASAERPADGARLVLAYQPADQCGDLVPGFAGHDQLTVFNLVRRQFQGDGSAIRFDHESGYAWCSMDATRHTADRFRRYASEIELLPHVIDNLKPAKLE